MWRSILIDWPAKAFDLWWTAYRLLVIGLVMVMVSVTALALALQWCCSIRWGW